MPDLDVYAVTLAYRPGDVYLYINVHNHLIVWTRDDTGWTASDEQERQAGKIADAEVADNMSADGPADDWPWAFLRGQPFLSIVPTTPQTTTGGSP